MGVQNPCSSTPTLNLFLNFNLLLKPSKHTSIQLFMYSIIHVLNYFIHVLNYSCTQVF